jgi:hypothetical protein
VLIKISILQQIPEIISRFKFNLLRLILAPGHAAVSYFVGEEFGRAEAKPRSQQAEGLSKHLRGGLSGVK